MLKSQLVSVIENLEVGQEVKITSSTFTFGLKKIVEFDDVVVIFGGYGTHYSIWATEIYVSEEIAEKIIDHASEYHSDLDTGNIELEELEIV